MHVLPILTTYVETKLTFFMSLVLGKIFLNAKNDSRSDFSLSAWVSSNGEPVQLEEDIYECAVEHTKEHELADF